MSGTTLVVGASGRVGGEVARLLLARGESVRAAARDPLSCHFSDSVEAVAFDFDKPESFAPALRGAEKVFLIARPGDNHSDEAAMPLIDEAKTQGVRLIVNLTAMGVEHFQYRARSSGTSAISRARGRPSGLTWKPRPSSRPSG